MNVSMIPIISLQKAVEILASGGVVVVPTETAYGLAADATNDQAVNKIYHIKGRSQAKPILILVNSLEMAMRCAKFSDTALGMAQKYWPGPLTLVLSRRNTTPIPPLILRGVEEEVLPNTVSIGSDCSSLEVSANLNLTDNTIAIRWTSNQMCQEIIAQLGKPITATSANVSGMETCYTIEDVQKQFSTSKILPDALIDGGVLREGEVSTMAKIDGDEVKVIRNGVIRLSDCPRTVIARSESDEAISNMA